MTEKVIIYTQDNGVLAVVIPAPQSRRVLRFPGKPPMTEPEDGWLARVKAKSVPAGTKDVRIVNRSDLPRDRTARDAWKHRNGRIS